MPRADLVAGHDQSQEDSTQGQSASGPQSAAGPARPLGSYVAFLGAYSAVVLGAMVALRRRLPGRLSAPDLALAALATHKVSRVLANEKVTSPIRAPFVELHHDPRTGKTEERPAATTGPRRAVGELLKCPFCLSQWVATGFTVGMVVAPRTIRLLASALAVSTAADFLQIGYTAAHDRA